MGLVRERKLDELTEDLLCRENCGALLWALPAGLMPLFMFLPLDLLAIYYYHCAVVVLVVC